MRDIFEEFPELANAKVRIWFCPVEAHGRRDTVTVEWRGDTAYCTESTCDRNSDQPWEEVPA